jgi:SAM-dependent methyltransferase
MSEQDYKAVVKRAAADEKGFVRLTLSGRLRGDDTPWIKVTVRPVLIRGERRMQFSYFDAKKDVTKNFALDEAMGRLDEALSMGFGRVHVQTTSGELLARITRKGKVLMTEAKPSRAAAAPTLAHDRAKRRMLDAGDAFLQAIGITGKDGRVLGSMHGKFAQVNEFLRIMEQALGARGDGRGPVSVVDCGCGNATLTFAACHYLNHARGVRASVVGVDTNEELIDKCTKLRDRLGWKEIDFRRSSIAEYAPSAPPDIVLSLHACDTATDEAIAKGVLWGSRFLFAAPCCQHELHKQLRSEAFAAVLRHGVLRERLADILTDALRAAALRVMGYRTDVIEFVSPEATSKNVMIRAEKAGKPGDAAALREYLALKEHWKVEPAIERMLGEGMRRHLER